MQHQQEAQSFGGEDFQGWGKEGQGWMEDKLEDQPKRGVGTVAEAPYPDRVCPK